MGSAAPTTPAVVLLSGGMDSATTLALARADGFRPFAMTFDYGQRHRVELSAAEAVGRSLGVADHRWVRIDLQAFGGSALTDAVEVPKDREEPGVGAIPVTYVPARNTIFLAYALAYAEVVGSSDIYIGVNAVDYSGYPDCRPEFIQAFEAMARLATKAAVEGSARIRVHAPLIDWPKTKIIERGVALGVDYSLTHSCYDPTDTGAPCGRCDACRLRLRAFAEVGAADPRMAESLRHERSPR